MMVPDCGLVKEIACRTLQATSDAVVRTRLARDVLGLPANHPVWLQARRELDEHRWVQVLRGEQRPDGSWGRLHSQDVTAGQRIPTTEAGVARALALGLDADHPMLRAAAAHLTAILGGQIECCDPPEKNDRWPAGVQLFAAATLARIDPHHPAVDGPWQLWQEIAWRTLNSGRYDPEAEVLAHRAREKRVAGGLQLLEALHGNQQQRLQRAAVILRVRVPVAGTGLPSIYGAAA